ncbi:hypothetical protein [Sulfitobacter pontiacus]|jgi:hypothetical protein|uniref:hypothetical protein n=1 Tax=Sulfitobacter pontiacus TaxID=60137 RepID=UPI00241DE7A9|nr:hypothetical protein [Sulfitobacter pontiacus]|tara:strand:+ start:36059 stop:38284 length:2226 start_codon:yes stop_codon:yes gene_type:complete
MTFFLNGPETPPKIKANAPQEDLPTWGEGLMAAGSSAQLENDSNFVAARRRIGVRDDMARDVVPRLGMDQIRPIIEERNAKAIEQGMPSQVVEIPDTVEEAVALLGPNFASKAIEMARSAAEADPDAWADIDLSDEAIETQTNERLRAEYEDAQQILEMMPGGRAAAEFVGGMVGITADVKNLPFLALGGGGGSIARVMGREAAINMGAEAAFLPSQFEMAERLGIPDPSVASQLAMAAGAGAILGGGVAAAQRGWSYYKGRNQTKPIGRMDQLRTQIMVDQTEDILTSDTAQPFEQIDRLVAEAGADIEAAPYQLENPINPERPPLLPADPPEASPEQAPAVIAADAPTAPTPKSKKPANPRPTSLKSFVVNQGGIWKGDEGGDISALEYRRPGFLKNNKRVDSTAGNNGGGLPLDTMRERAVEQGYLPEGATVNDLIDALDSDVRGTRRIYSQAEEAVADEWRIFDGEGTSKDPDAVADFEAMQPTDGQFYVDRDAYEFGGNPEADIEMAVRGWMDDNGWSDILTDAESREIISVLQERGGDPEYLVERALEREVEYVESPNTAAADVPWDEPDQPRAEDGRPDADSTGRPEPDASEAGSSTARAADGSQADRATESTAAGDQTLIDGVAPVTQRDRLQAQQEAPMRGGNAAADDGLFDVGSRSQMDMFSDPASPEARAIQDSVAADMRGDIEADGDFDLEIETPDGGKRIMSAGSLLNYLDEGDAFSARIDLCGKGPA